MISADEASRELWSTTCHAPKCRRSKNERQSFCNACYRMLPEHMQRALYRQIGHGYERAYDEAKRCIAAKRLTAREVGAGRYTRIDYRKV